MVGRESQEPRRPGPAPDLDVAGAGPTGQQRPQRRVAVGAGQRYRLAVDRPVLDRHPGTPGSEPRPSRSPRRSPPSPVACSGSSGRRPAPSPRPSSRRPPPAPAQHDDPVGHCVGLLQVMRREQRGPPTVRPPAHRRPKASYASRRPSPPSVRPGRGGPDRVPARARTGPAGSPRRTARSSAGRPGRRSGPGPAPRRPAAPRVQRPHQVDQLAHRRLARQTARLQHRAHPALGAGRGGADRRCGPSPCPGGPGRAEVDRRRLPRPVRSEESDDLARRHRQVDVVDRHRRAVRLTERGQVDGQAVGGGGRWAGRRWWWRPGRWPWWPGRLWWPAPVMQRAEWSWLQCLRPTDSAQYRRSPARRDRCHVGRATGGTVGLVGKAGRVGRGYCVAGGASVDR